MAWSLNGMNNNNNNYIITYANYSIPGTDVENPIFIHPWWTTLFAITGIAILQYLLE